MSRTRIHLDGTWQWRDDGPAYARRQGFGGAALGQATTTFTVGPSKAVRTATQIRRAEMQRAAKARRKLR